MFWYIFLDSYGKFTKKIATQMSRIKQKLQILDTIQSVDVKFCIICVFVLTFLLVLISDSWSYVTNFMLLSKISLNQFITYPESGEVKIKIKQYFCSEHLCIGFILRLRHSQWYYYYFLFWWIIRGSWRLFVYLKARRQKQPVFFLMLGFTLVCSILCINLFALHNILHKYTHYLRAYCLRAIF